MKLSIILITYNHEKYIKQCLQSIISQKLDCAWELIVAYDYSNDNTLKIVNEFRGKVENFVVSIHDKNVGVCCNVADAIKLARGEFIGFIDGDDYNIDDYKYAKQIAILEQNESVNICFGNGYRYFQEENLLEPFYTELKRGEGMFDLESFYKEHIIANPTTLMLRRSCLPSLLPDFFFLSSAIDWVLISICASSGKIFFLNEFLSVYRVHKMSITRTISKVSWLEQGLRLNENMNQYLDYKHDEFLGNKSWYFEHLVYEYAQDGKYKNALIYFFKYLFSIKEKKISKIRYVLATLYYQKRGNIKG